MLIFKKKIILIFIFRHENDIFASKSSSLGYFFYLMLNTFQLLTGPEPSGREEEEEEEANSCTTKT